MADYPFIPEGLFPVQAIPITTTNAAGLDGDYINMSEVEMVWVVVQFYDGTASTDATTLEEAKTAAGGSSQAITNTVPIWYGVVTTASTKLTRQTDAVSYTTADVTGSKIMIFAVDPASLDSGFNWLCVKIAASGHADDFAGAIYWIKPKYQEQAVSRATAKFVA